MSDQVISPTATSRGPIRVASTESYSLAYLSLKKTLYVESKTAPFIADEASIAGATNTAYGTCWPPSVVTVPTSAPSPMPSENRYRTGSMKPVTKATHSRRKLSAFRSTSMRARPAPAGTGTTRVSQRTGAEITRRAFV